MSAPYDAAAHSTGPVPPRSPLAPPSSYRHLPDVYRPRRRFLPPALMTLGMFAVTAAGFYGAEAILPLDYKPSHFIGGYQREIAQAQAEGQLAARIAYDGRLKLIETDAVRWQERCRAGFQNFNNLYQASYARANMYAQTTADVQRNYMAARIGVAQQTTAGDITVANLGDLFGVGISLIDPETGQRSFDLAEKARTEALKKLDEAAQGGVTISVAGWNDGLPDPATLQAPTLCDLPTSFAAPQFPIGG